MKWKKRLISLLLTLSLGAGLGVPAAAASAYTPVQDLQYTGRDVSFTDVKSGDWFAGNLSLLVQAGGINGYEDGTFRPNSGLKLCEFLKMVTTLLYPSYVEDFADYTFGGEALWYAPYVGLAEATGLLKGVTYTKAALEANVNRYTMAVLITNAVDLRGETLSRDKSIQYFIRDYYSMPYKYRLPVRDAYQMGILAGKDAYGNFCGNDGLTRAEACTVVMRLFEEGLRQSYYREYWDVSRQCRLLIRMPAEWFGRVLSREVSGGRFQVEYVCVNAVDGQHEGILFSVVVSDQAVNQWDTEYDYLGKVSSGSETHYVYVVYPDTMQYDGFNEEIQAEYVGMDEDMKNNLVTFNVVID